MNIASRSKTHVTSRLDLDNTQRTGLNAIDQHRMMIDNILDQLAGENGQFHIVIDLWSIG